MTVIVGQCDQFQTHSHNICDSVSGDVTGNVADVFDNKRQRSYGYPISGRYGNETRPKNVTIKIWRRTV